MTTTTSKTTRAKVRLTKTAVDAAAPEATRYVQWDLDLPGFGVLVHPTGAKQYVTGGRLNGRKLPLTRLGNVKAISPDTARDLAKKALGQIAHGIDPNEAKRAARHRGLTVEDLCLKHYIPALDAGEIITRGGYAKSATTITTDKSRINGHIIPLLGKRFANDVTQADVQKFVVDVAAGKTAKARESGRGRDRSGGKGAASRTWGLLGGIFSFGIERGLVTSSNPCKGVKVYKSREIERFLSPDEYKRLGAAIARAESDGVNPQAIAAATLITLTGLRKGEALGLRWDQVDFTHACLRFARAKSGQRTIMLNRHAVELLMQQRELRVLGNPFVFPSKEKGKHFVGLPKVWKAIIDDARLDAHLRIHDARHSLASAAINSGVNLPVIGKMLGHASLRSTARYAHIADEVLARAVDQVGQNIGGGLRGKVVKRRRA